MKVGHWWCQSCLEKRLLGLGIVLIPVECFMRWLHNSTDCMKNSCGDWLQAKLYKQSFLSSSGYKKYRLQLLFDWRSFDATWYWVILIDTSKLLSTDTQPLTGIVAIVVVCRQWNTCRNLVLPLYCLHSLLQSHPVCALFVWQANASKKHQSMTNSTVDNDWN